MESVEIKISKGRQRYIDLAINIAQQSEYPTFKHGAVLVRGTSIINTSCNKYSYTRFGARFRRADYGCATVHAELGSILNIPRSQTEGATVYVVRVNRQGETLMSKPCHMCEAAMRHCGIKRVIFSTNTGFSEWRL